MHSVNPKIWQEEKGATLLEFVLVFGVFLAIVFISIEVFNYQFAKGLIESGSQRGVNLASKIPGLDQGSGDDFDLAKQKVMNITKESFSGFIGDESSGTQKSFRLVGEPELIFPIIKGGETLADALQRAPLTIRIRAKYRPLFSRYLSIAANEIDMEVEALSYREPLLMTSMPIPTDCHNRTLGDPLFGTDCAVRPVISDDWGSICASDPYTCTGDIVDGRCVCRGERAVLDVNGYMCDCECPGNFLRENPSVRGSDCVCQAPARINTAGDQCICHVSREERLNCNTHISYFRDATCECFTRNEEEKTEFCHSTGGTMTDGWCRCPSGWVNDRGINFYEGYYWQNTGCCPASNPDCLENEVPRGDGGDGGGGSGGSGGDEGL